MIHFKNARNWVLFILIMGCLPLSAYSYSNMTTSSSCGQHSSIHDYYYNDNSSTTIDDNIFLQQVKVVQDMNSTSDLHSISATYEIAASHIVAGTTIADYEERSVTHAPRKVLGSTGWGPPNQPVPIGDGWSVIVFLTLLAIGYHVAVKRKNVEN